jgi:hypothetical protein
MSVLRSFVRRGLGLLGLGAALVAMSLTVGCESKPQEQTDPAKRQQSLEQQKQLHQMEMQQSPASKRAKSR